MDQAKRLRELVLESEGDKRARVLAVTSGKGGVGKTNLAIALALAAARRGRNVLLLDGDLGLANVDVILDIQPHYNLSHVIAGEVTIEKAITSVPGGLRILPGAAGLTRLADLSATEHRSFLQSMARLERDSELILVDTGAGLSRRTVDFCIASSEVLVVTTPEPTAITDAYAMIKVLAQRDRQLQVWLAVNMANNKSEAEEISERITTLSRRFLAVDVRPAGYVLQDSWVPQAVRRRVPFSLANPSTPASRCVEEMASNLGLAGATDSEKEGFFQRVTSLLSRPHYTSKPDVTREVKS